VSKLLRVSSLVLLALLLASASYAATPPVLVISDSAGDSLTIDSTGTLTCVGSCSAAPATVTPGTVSCSVTVAPPVSASCVSITAVQGVAITPVTMTATGGTGTGYTFTATGLPPGITISSSGTISGTPTASGTFPYTLTIKDSAGDTGTVNCSVTAAPVISASCVSITTNQGIAIVPVTLTASGGAGGPYTFTATGLPSGLTMSSSDIIDVLRETGRQRIRQPGSEDFIRAAR
jgi:Putative Ig domain